MVSLYLPQELTKQFSVEARKSQEALLKSKLKISPMF